MTGFGELEVEQIIIAVKTWAKRSQIDSFAVVGSWARKQARSDSDLDLMFLTSNLELFFKDITWFDRIPWDNLNLTLDRAMRSHLWSSSFSTSCFSVWTKNRV